MSFLTSPLMSIRIFGLLMAFTAAIFSVSSFAKEQRVVLEADRDRILRSDNPQEIDIYLKELQHPGSLNYEANFLAGLLHLKRDRLDAAVAAFSTITPASTLYLDARNNIAAIYAAQGKLELAKKTLDEVIKTNKSLEVVYKNLNNLKFHLASKNLSSALQTLDAGKSPKPSLTVLTGATSVKTENQLRASATESIKVASAQSEPVTSKSGPAANTAPTMPAAVSSPPTSAPSKPAKSQAPPVSVPADATASLSPSSNEAIQRSAKFALEEWSKAWEKKDVDAYLGAYAQDFVPNDGKTRSQWASERKSRILNKGQINIQLSQIDVKAVSAQTVKIRFRQNYRSDKLSVSSIKTIEMKKIGDRWLITSERS